jgi:hypothetical protein
MTFEVDINDNSEICSEKVLYPQNEGDNTDSEKDVDINNKIKRTRENKNVNGYKGVVLKKFLDEYGNEYPITGGKTGYNTHVYYDDDELNEEEERLIMEDQQEQLIDKDEFECDSEYKYTGGKDRAVLYEMQQEHYKQIINEDGEESNNNNAFPKHIFLYHKRSFLRKDIIKYKFNMHEEFNKQTLLVAIKKE